MHNSSAPHQFNRIECDTNNSFSNQDDEQLYAKLSTFWYCFLAFITTVGLVVSLVSNIIIIYLFTRINSLRQNPSNIIAVNLSLSDLLYCTQWPSVIYCSLTQSIGLLEINFVCQTFGFISVSTALASILTVLAMSIERAFVITHSIHAKDRFTIRNAWLVVVLIWILAICSCVPPLFGHVNRYTLDPSKTSCTLDYLSNKSNHKIYILILYVVYWILPAVLITICYASIIVTFKRSSKSLKQAGQPNNITNDNSQNSPSLTTVSGTLISQRTKRVSLIDIFKQTQHCAANLKVNSETVANREQNHDRKQLQRVDSIESKFHQSITPVEGTSDLSRSELLESRQLKLPFQTTAATAALVLVRANVHPTESTSQSEASCKPIERPQSSDVSLSSRKIRLPRVAALQRSASEYQSSSAVRIRRSTCAKRHHKPTTTSDRRETCLQQAGTQPKCFEFTAPEMNDMITSSDWCRTSKLERGQSEVSLTTINSDPLASTGGASCNSGLLSKNSIKLGGILRAHSVKLTSTLSGLISRQNGPVSLQLPSSSGFTIATAGRPGGVFHVGASSSQLNRNNIQIRLAKMAFYLILLWFVSWTPIATLAMLNSLVKCHHRASALALFTANTMTKLGPAFDVFIYGVSHPRIKSRFKQIVKWMLTFGHSQAANNPTSGRTFLNQRISVRSNTTTLGM